MNKYPFAIVWTPLPVITWFLPLIGHTGITDSNGIIHDFGGSYYVSVDHMTFGKPTKYVKLDPSKAEASDWDAAIQVSADRFRLRQHNLIVNNCHNHVADTLNEMNYNGRNDYTQFDVFLLTLKAEYIGASGFLKQWGIFILLLILVITLIYLN